MTDTPPSTLFDDPNASHPLDLLINAIHGEGEYEIPPEARDGHGGFNLEQLLGQESSTSDEPNRNKRKRSESPINETDEKTAKLIQAHIVRASADRSKPILSRGNPGGVDPVFSTVEVWHPTAGQKSYAKERRMLNPPPILRVSGPLLRHLENVTLQTIISEPDPGRPDGILASQTQIIPLSDQILTTSDTQPGATTEKAEKEERIRHLRETASRGGFGQTLSLQRAIRVPKERHALSDGLTFPMLWVADRIGRDKEFRLELAIGEPGVETNELPVSQPLVSAPSALVDHHMDEPVHTADNVTDSKQPDSESAPTDLFSEHQTLDQASNDIIQQLTEEDRQMFAAEPQVEPGITKESGVNDLEVRSKRWATFVSAPIAVVSKPSQKTAKARSMDSCLSVDSSFALWVRVHSQTVRTKYMKFVDGDEPCLTTRTSSWTPFKFEVVQRAALPVISPRDRHKRPSGDHLLTYGSLGYLVDRQSGVKTELMRLVRIDKSENIVGIDHGHPVSDLQRVGFVRLHNGEDDYTGGSRWYLSAPGARLGGADLKVVEKPASVTAPTDNDPQTLDGVPGTNPEATVATPSSIAKKGKKPKTKRFALAEVVVAENEGGAAFALNWIKADRYEAERERGFGKKVERSVETCERVEDWMCWILGGVDKFSYSFFDIQKPGSLFTAPIDPVPRHLAAPVFSPQTNNLVMTLNEFFYGPGQTLTDFKTYLGPIGPLTTTLHQSVAPDKAGPDDGHSAHFEAIHYDLPGRYGPMRPARSDYPGNKPHIIVVVNMPPAPKIIRAMQECHAEAQYQSNALHPTLADATTGTEGWLTANESAIDTDDNARDQKIPPVDAKEHAAQQDEVSLSIDPTLRDTTASHAQAQHDVDDITAALAAHASDSAFSLSHIDHGFLSANFEPTLGETGQQEENQNQGAGTNLAVETDLDPALQPSDSSPDTVPDLQLSKSEQGLDQVEMVPLPIVLVRTLDGVGFTVGRNVVAERVDSRGPGEKPRWGLRVLRD